VTRKPQRREPGPVGRFVPHPPATSQRDLTAAGASLLKPRDVSTEELRCDAAEVEPTALAHWLQHTSRDGDMQLPVHSQIAQVSGRLRPAKIARSGFRRCHFRRGGACFGEFGGSEDRDGQPNQDRAESPGHGE
jgi:hypothetical protein